MMNFVADIPKCDQIASEIEAQIRNGQIPENSKLSGIRNLANQYGVSNKVIELAMNQLAVQGLVEKQVGRGTFVKAAKTVFSREHITAVKSENSFFSREQITAFISYYQSYNFESYFYGLAEELLNSGMSLLYCNYNKELSSPDMEKAEDMLWKIVLKQPKSLLIDTFYLSDYQHIRKKFPGVPVCLVHNELPSQEIDCSGVFVDYAALFDKAFEYLLNKGHRKILTIGFFPDLNPNDSRFRIIAESVQRNGGILGSKEFPYLCYLDFLKNPAKLNEVFKNKDDYPTAFVGMNDHIIYQSIITFKERFPHLSVPEAIGIYDTSWSQMPGNEFHSFNLNFQELWKKAIAVLNNEYSGGKSFHWISPTFIERIQTERSCN